MKLYKYRGFRKNSSEKKWTKKIITEQELFFSGIEAFNDPFDGRVKLRSNGKLNEIKAAQVRVQYTNKLVKEEKYEGITLNQAFDLVNERISEELISNDEYKKELQTKVQKIHNEKGVLSLSSIPDNILMWSHYSDNHTGICFGFDWNKDDEVFGNYKKIRYQTHYDDIWSWLHTDNEIVESIIYNKSIDWHYEKEYRIILDSISARKFNKENLKEIIFGCKTSEEDINEIIELVKDNNLKVNFKKAEIDVNRYALNISKYKSS
ncbi:DUF2971 domain-containing protein [Seonamhaeicola sediminis]|uniref:DUF2971 domain-containing protein n=1 Tax=Seonamhaeicola sediminis TaxID=2528206 RepID=A0A562YAR9_9FLAO|nr:DUF2971 domain-containing protein [Seonamhaeicola sediminis]TWO31501.1 DUF2971 domain-containing protein [Seonamhaeicola sediminis]